MGCRQGCCYTAPSWVEMGSQCAATDFAREHLFPMRAFLWPCGTEGNSGQSCGLHLQTDIWECLHSSANGMTSSTWVLAQRISCPDTIHCLLHCHTLPSLVQLYDLHVWLLQHTASPWPCTVICANLGLWPYRIDPTGLIYIGPVLSLHKEKFDGLQEFHYSLCVPLIALVLHRISYLTLDLSTAWGS